MKNLKTIIALCLLILSLDVPAQDTTFWNREMTLIAKPKSENNIIYFRENFKADPLRIFEDRKAAFGLGNNDELRLKKVSTDKFGSKHYRFDQYYKGIPLYDCEYIVHQRADGTVYAANGKMRRGLNVPVAAVVSEASALPVAMRQINPVRGMWNFPKQEELLRQKLKDQAATYFPKGELVFRSRDGGRHINTDDFVLCWKFDLNVYGGVSKRVFVNALTGDLLNETPISDLCNPGSVETVYDSYGTQSIWMDFNLGAYRLYDNCHGAPTHTLSHNQDTDESLDRYSANTFWSNDEDGFIDVGAATAHWAVSQTRDYYAEFFTRNSWNGGGGDIIVYANTTMDVNGAEGTSTNACWGCYGDIVALGYGTEFSDPSDDYNTLDIVGHEFTHGVDQSEGDLDGGNNESGALAESYSDIFGTLVEMHSITGWDWHISRVGRDMDDPNTSGDPDTYLTDPLWDNSSKYSMCNVNNYWFYLLFQGGSGINHNGVDYNVSGIGNDADDIVYSVLTDYFESNSDFHDARTLTILAAEEIYGSCSNQAIQVGLAWHAVGVGPEAADDILTVCGDIPIGTYDAVEVVRGGGDCTTTISLMLGNVNFEAGSDVHLYPGFEVTAVSGKTFAAYIDVCNYTLLKTTDQQTQPVDSLSSLNSSERIISVYPNPATASVKLTFELESDASVSVTLKDITGRVIKAILSEELLSTGAHQYDPDISGLPSGSYFFDVNIDGLSTIKKLIVQH